MIVNDKTDDLLTVRMMMMMMMMMMIMMMMMMMILCSGSNVTDGHHVYSVPYSILEVSTARLVSFQLSLKLLIV